MFKSPMDFAENIRLGKHIVLFYENAEYCRSVTFAFLKSGMKNKEACFYFTSDRDTDFYKNDFIQTMFGSNITYEYNKNPNLKFEEKLLHIENFDESVHDDTSTHSLSNNIINIVNSRTQAREKKEELDNEGSGFSRLILKFSDKMKSKDQIEKNMQWEKNFRNNILRKYLPNTSLLCAYPLDKIIETLSGQSALFSYWMSELLEIYDGVIYANANWKGVGFDLGR